MIRTNSIRWRIPSLSTAAGILFAALLLAAPALADEADSKAAPKADLEPQARRLIRQLDAPQLKQREAAETELLKLGPALLPQLPAPNDRDSAELKQRLARIRQSLERARDEAYTQPSRVTLEGKFKLSAALAEVEKQTGNRVIDYREEFGQEASDPEIDLKLEDATFWRALDKIIDKAELAIYPFADQQAIALVARGDDQPFRGDDAAYVGAFRLQATKIYAERNLLNPSRRSLDLTMEAQWEPRLAPIALIQPLDAVTATDDRGEPINIAMAEAQLETPINSGVAAVELQLPLVPPSREASKIASIKGRLTALVAGGSETFEFKDIEKAKQLEQRRGGAVVTLEQVRKNNAVWEVRMSIRFDENAGALESHRSWVFNNQAYLSRGEGEPIKPDGYETTRQTENEVGIAYLFDVPDGLAGKSFVYRSPTVVLRLPLDYELRDLELP